MKRLLPAFIMALTIHGLFMGTAQKWLKKTYITKPVPRVITMTLTYRLPPSPPRTIKKAPIQQEPVVMPTPVVKKVKPEPLKPPEPLKKTPKPVRPAQKREPDTKPKKKDIPRPYYKQVPTHVPEPEPESRQIMEEQEIADFFPETVEQERPVAEQVIPDELQAPQEKVSTNEGDLPGEEIYSDLGDTEEEMAVPEAEEKERPAHTERISRAGTNGRMLSDTAVVHKAKPVYKVNLPPEYPGLARRRGYEGTVILEVLVDAQGGVGDVRLFKSSEHGVLDRAATAAVKKWLFEPGTKGGVPVKMWVRVPIRFRLK